MSEDNKNKNENESVNVGRRVLVELLNISLLPHSYNEFIETDWYAIARTTFYIGNIGLLIWWMYLLMAWGVLTLTSFTSMFGLTRQIASIGPLAPVLIFIFSILSNRSSKRLKQIYIADQDENLDITLLAISIVALILAAAYRWALFSTLNDTYGNTLSGVQIVSTMILDGLYVSLLLVGIGGLASFVLKPDEE